MRILQLDSGREMRGGQWQVLYLLRGLRECGHEARLLAREDAPLFNRAALDGFDVAPLSWVGVARRRAWADVVHAHDARSHAMAAVAGGRLVVARRVAFPVRTGLLSRWKYRRASHYAAISKFVAGKLIEAGVQFEAITVVYDGVALAPDGAGPRDARVVAPATGDPMKGSDLLRDAAALASADLRFSSDLPRDLPGAGAFAYITRSEGLGSAVLLAMAHGVPVVASRVGGLPEAVEHGRSGLLVENRPEEIARALRAVLDDEGVAARFAEAGRERAARLFSLDRMVADTIATYGKVLS